MKNNNSQYAENILAGLITGYGLSTNLLTPEKQAVKVRDIKAIEIDNDLANEMKILFNKFKDIFNSDEEFSVKLKITDDFADEYFDNPDIKELLIDCLFISNYTDQINSENSAFFETEKWKKTEKVLEYRGTQLLDGLLYIDEVSKSSKVPELEDFLENYLLLNEEGFEEEAVIYEALDKNKELISDTPADIYLVGENLDIDSVIKPYFIPMMFFFKNPKDIEGNLLIMLELGKSDIFSLTSICMLLSAYNGINSFPENLKIFTN